ncbi:phosphopantetheine-binding protein, partial [Nostoc sp.]
PNVRENVVVVRQDEPGNLQLVAYVVAKTEPVPSISELRSFLKEKLPDHMLPSAFMMLENLPLAPSGKVDRKALPKPDNLRPELETAYVLPRNEMEHVIADIWQKILKVEKVGIQDNFFDLGGHSLNVLQVYSKLRELYKADLVITDLFKYPTISSIARYLNQEEDDSFTIQSNELNDQLEAGKARLKKRLLQNRQ